ncbi:hypothetical protein PV04_00340 [Phialophora macrospora]|uniref:Uncharacterized protein n=1 Tax=Phialophora macrospora TaxID=1851006 RepID=A0A0D2G056_9EURO|nr:hypothetical protein PV04_00340 [Phialophora macrospora]
MSEPVSIRTETVPLQRESATFPRLKQKWLPIFPNRKSPDIWPDPSNSVGRRCLDSNEGTVWEAVGPAREAFTQIAKVVQDLLESNADYLDKGEEVSPTLSYGLWMIGKHATNAVPTIVLGCSRRPVRKRAESLIKKNGVLDQYPGIVLKTSSATPRPLADGGYVTATRGATINLYTIGSPERSCGVSVLVGRASGPAATRVRKATIGGFVHLNHVSYGMTVAHAFSEGVGPPDTSAGPVDYIHFDDDSESESEDRSFVEGTSRGL